ncbi:MAG: UvrD-helicase domain-containing protein [Caulobacterales bacterium]
MTSSESMAENIPISERARARPAIRATYLDGLNPEQRLAVETTDGPVLVLSGAGTGKTRVLTARVAHLLATGKTKPWAVLVVTFTNKASREMRERAAALLGEFAEPLPWLGTFHSVAAQILRRHAELVGLKSNFTILDDDDQQRLLKQVIEAANIDVKRWTPRFLQALIDGWKNRAMGPEQITPRDAYAFAEGRGAELYATYQDRLKVLNACDFGDLLVHNIKIFQKHPDLLQQYQDKFRYILVDEYQDTNVAQYLWLRLLAQAHKNLCVVGDDDQSIYGWRGAEVDNILRFEKDFPGAKVIRLERNYRSTEHILAAASGLIESNTTRLGKTLWTEETGGELVRVRGLWDGEAEARFVGDEIETWRARGRPYSQCAVLVRASWQMRAFEERFIMLGLPYRVIGGPRFFERAEIRDAHAYLRLIRSEDDDLAFERVVNQPKRGIGDSSVQKLSIAARGQNLSLVKTAQLLAGTDEIRGQARTGLAAFLNDLERWRAQSLVTKHTDLMEQILEESGYTDMLRADKSPQAATRLENLKELINAMAQFDSLNAYLEHVELVLDVDRSGDDDQVQILTLHSAKGLEWPMVFLPGWEETVFPSQRSLDEKGNSALEEERRLAYVGITRAREKAIITFTANRQIYGRWQSVLPSRFVDELPHKHVEAESDTGYAPVSSFGDRASVYDNAGNFGSTYDSPGWRRAQAAREQRGPSRPPLIEGRALVVSSTADESKFQMGLRVFHQKFGYGRIETVEGNKLTVAFEKAGVKKVIDSFVTTAERQ